MKKLKTHHKVGAILALLGVALLASSVAFPTLGSYLFIAGIVSLFVGCFIIAPDYFMF